MTKREHQRLCRYLKQQLKHLDAVINAMCQAANDKALYDLLHRVHPVPPGTCPLAPHHAAEGKVLARYERLMLQLEGYLASVKDRA